MEETKELKEIKIKADEDDIEITAPKIEELKSEESKKTTVEEKA